MPAPVPESVQRLAATCFHRATSDSDGVAALQAASRLLTASVALRVGHPRAHALATLALTLAKAEFVALRTVEAQPDGGLSGLSSALAREDRAQVERIAVAILAHHLHLFGTLTNAAVINSVVAEMWPATRQD